MERLQKLILVASAGILLVACGQKKQTQDIIVPKEEVKAPQGPIRMQDYKQTNDIQWLGKPYQVEVTRIPDDSLRMVTDEDGQKFVDTALRFVFFVAMVVHSTKVALRKQLSRTILTMTIARQVYLKALYSIRSREPSLSLQPAYAIRRLMNTFPWW